MTVIELDDATMARAETLLRSPDFPAPYEEKKLKHDDLYTPIRPMKIATPVRVNNKQRDVAPPLLEQQAPAAHVDASYGVEEMLGARPTNIAAPVRVDRQGGYLSELPKTDTDEAYFRRPEQTVGTREVQALATDESLSHLNKTRDNLRQIAMLEEQEERNRAMLEQEYRGAVGGQNNDMARYYIDDHVQAVQEEILRTKQLLGICPRENSLDLAASDRQKVVTNSTTMLDIQASMDKIDAEIAGLGEVPEERDCFGDLPQEREERKLRLKEEVAHLREQVMQARSARVERILSQSSWDGETSTDYPSTAWDEHSTRRSELDASPRGPELWGSRRRRPEPPEQERPVEPEGKVTRGQQCLTGGGALCFPARQCA